jgi:hypothetical protein
MTKLHMQWPRAVRFDRLREILANSDKSQLRIDCADLRELERYVEALEQGLGNEKAKGKLLRTE